MFFLFNCWSIFVLQFLYDDSCTCFNVIIVIKCLIDLAVFFHYRNSLKSNVFFIYLKYQSWCLFMSFKQKSLISCLKNTVYQLYQFIFFFFSIEALITLSLFYICLILYIINYNCVMSTAFFKDLIEMH